MSQLYYHAHRDTYFPPNSCMTQLPPQRCLSFARYPLEGVSVCPPQPCMKIPNTSIYEAPTGLQTPETYPESVHMSYSMKHNFISDLPFLPGQI